MRYPADVTQHGPTLPPASHARAPSLQGREMLAENAGGKCWRKMLAQARPALAGCLSVAPRARATSNPQSQSQAAMIPGIAGCTFRTCGAPQPHWRVSFHTAEEGGKCCRERTRFAASHSAVA
jgi:hypothetical protein